MLLIVLLSFFLSSAAMAASGAVDPTPTESVTPAEAIANTIAPPSRSAWVLGFANASVSDHYHWSTGGGMVGLNWVLCRVKTGIALRYDQLTFSRFGIGEGPVFDVSATRAVFTLQSANKSPAFCNWMASYAFNQYHRDIDSRGRQFATSLDAGYAWERCQVIVKPSVSVYYSQLEDQAYLIKNKIIAPTFAFNGPSDETYIEQSSRRAEALELGFDLKLAYRNVFEKAQVHPYVHAKITYDALYNPFQRFSARQVLGGGTAFFVSEADSVKHWAQVGTGIEVFGDHNLSVVIKYDYSFKPNYHDHAVMLSMQYDG